MQLPLSINRRHLILGSLLLPAIGMAAAPQPLIEVWKDPSCGCCKDWIVAIRQAGFTVNVFETGNNGMRAQLGLPAKLGSCHTARVAGYVIEGHVPVRDIKRLLLEKHDALGLTVPGMKVGSPGMDGPIYKGRKDPYQVLLVRRDSSTTVYQSYS